MQRTIEELSVEVHFMFERFVDKKLKTAFSLLKLVSILQLSFADILNSLSRCGERRGLREP